jgi:hypothetical protein
MTRKDFLKAFGCAGLLALTGSTGALAAPSTAFRACRASTEYLGQLEHPPEAVFPLLCPVREFEWLDGWKCDMVYSISGVAEENCIFTTMPGPSVWNVDRYEPPLRIAFTVVSTEQVIRLNITLRKTASGGTELKWQRMFTGLNEAGNAIIHAWNTDWDRSLTQAIDHFLRTGKMMRKS